MAVLLYSRINGFRDGAGGCSENYPILGGWLSFGKLLPFGFLQTADNPVKLSKNPPTW
jgi:hypothetical protein